MKKQTDKLTFCKKKLIPAKLLKYHNLSQYWGGISAKYCLYEKEIILYRIKKIMFSGNILPRLTFVVSF